MMAGNGGDAHQDKARRFRDAALPHLNDVYTLARYLLRDAADADDAAQECYLRALRYFDTFRGTEIKPWLFAILRNVCRGEFARRSHATLAMDDTTDDAEDAAPLWQEEQASPERKRCVSGMQKRSAVSLRSFPTRFVRRSFCGRSMICHIARSLMS
jgi:RNA polymerase sigma-70 factor, ECF subfamily